MLVLQHDKELALRKRAEYIHEKVKKAVFRINDYYTVDEIVRIVQGRSRRALPGRREPDSFTKQQVMLCLVAFERNGIVKKGIKFDTLYTISLEETHAP